MIEDTLYLRPEVMRRMFRPIPNREGQFLNHKGQVVSPPMFPLEDRINGSRLLCGCEGCCTPNSRQVSSGAGAGFRTEHFKTVKANPRQCDMAAKIFDELPRYDFRQYIDWDWVRSYL